MPNPTALTINRLRVVIAMLCAEIDHLATSALPEAGVERLVLTASIQAAAGDIISVAEACAVLSRRSDIL